MEIKFKIWLEKDGHALFGEGRDQLLKAIDDGHGLYGAAKQLKMSYRAAWGKVRDYEDRLGVGLLEKGRHGRVGAHLTEEGKLIVSSFREIMQEMDRTVSSGSLPKIMEKIGSLGSA